MWAACVRRALMTLQCVSREVNSHAIACPVRDCPLRFPSLPFYSDIFAEGTAELHARSIRIPGVRDAAPAPEARVVGSISHAARQEQLLLGRGRGGGSTQAKAISNTSCDVGILGGVVRTHTAANHLAPFPSCV